ncbi:hypothetical protein V6N13_068431 [Hibiscus sabdariffa]|uniref:Uncharacterized protein n=1 Tax=Hibiscus sabdariffa TaxID=183260 RepID=A0ABR2QMR0_9ROSI
MFDDMFEFSPASLSLSPGGVPEHILLRLFDSGLVGLWSSSEWSHSNSNRRLWTSFFEDPVTLIASLCFFVLPGSLLFLIEPLFEVVGLSF